MKNLLLLVLPLCGLAQDIPFLTGKLSLATLPLSEVELSAITTKCFSGFNMKTCVSIPPTDDTVYGYDLEYYKLTLATAQQPYCLQCCSLNPLLVDNWQVECVVDPFTSQTTNAFGYEFRFSSKQSLGSENFITCPLKRNACTYDESGKLLACSSEASKTFLHGYTLKLNVLRYTSSFDSWRSVTSCESTSIESNVALNSGDIFTESMVMTFGVAPFDPKQPINLAFFALFAILGIYFLLYFCRQKCCPICQKKLVLFPDRCYVCIFLCADLPDPVLRRVLEAKGRRIINNNHRPRLTYIQTIATSFTGCCKILTDLLYQLRKNKDSFIYPIGSKGAAETAINSQETAQNNSPDIEVIDQEAQVNKNSLKNNKRSIGGAPERQYYKENMLRLKIPEMSRLSSGTKRMPDNPPVAAVADLESLNSLVHNVSLKDRLFSLSPSSKKIPLKARTVEEILKSRRATERNPRKLHYQKQILERVTDDSLSNKNPAGISKNKFIYDRNAKVVPRAPED